MTLAEIRKFKVNDIVKAYDAIGKVMHVLDTSPQCFVLFLHGRQLLLVDEFDLELAPAPRADERE